MEKLSRNEYRTLVVLYKLAGGEAGVDVAEEDIYKEINNKMVYSMSDEEFDNYHKEVLKEIKLRKN